MIKGILQSSKLDGECNERRRRQEIRNDISLCKWFTLHMATWKMSTTSGKNPHPEKLTDVAPLGGWGHESPLRSGLLWQLQKSVAHIQSIKTFFTPSHLVVSKLRVQQSRRLTSAKTNSSSNIAFNVGHESWHSVINTVKQSIQILVLFFKHFRYARLTSVCVGCNATLNGGVANFGKFYFICIEVITWQTG